MVTVQEPQMLTAPRMWQALEELVLRLESPGTVEERLGSCLELLVETLSADRGLLVLVRGSARHVVTARASATVLTTAEWSEASRSIIDEAILSGEAVVRSGLIGQRSQSMVDLDIALAMAAPVRSGARSALERAVFYVDFRTTDRHISRNHVDLFKGACRVISLALLRDDEPAVPAPAESRRTGRPQLDEILSPPSLAHLRAEVRSLVRGVSPVLVLGESGTGKTLLATALAEASARGPVVRATLGSSDDLNTITSELFGHERGAFSGAIGKRIGLVEYAHGGTLIFDEILNLPPLAQQLLLDFTQFGTYRPLGYAGREPRRADVRLISATNGDLDAAMEAGRFRRDLYYRLSATTLLVPPLRERRQDIVPMAEAFLRALDPERPWALTVAARRLLTSPEAAWPGNVRELESRVARARERALADDPAALVLDGHHLQPGRRHAPASIPSRSANHASAKPTDWLHEWNQLQAARSELENRELSFLEALVSAFGGVHARAARAIDLPRTTLVSRLGAPPVPRRAAG